MAALNTQPPIEPQFWSCQPARLSHVHSCKGYVQGAPWGCTLGQVSSFVVPCLCGATTDGSWAPSSQKIVWRWANLVRCILFCKPGVTPSQDAWRPTALLRYMHEHHEYAVSHLEGQFSG